MKKLTKKECLDYWKNNTNKQNTITDLKNHPIVYACKPKTIIGFIHNFWTPEVSKTDRILEVGCNSGSNINHLYNLGYTNLSGIDINEYAMSYIPSLFPEAFNKTDLYTGSLEEVLPTLKNKSIDVILSMAVLEHIHPDSADEVFENIVRVADKYIITNEYEGHKRTNNRVFERNYKTVFESIGCKQIKVVENPNIQPEYGYFYIKQNNKLKVIRNVFKYNEHITRMFKKQ